MGLGLNYKDLDEIDKVLRDNCRFKIQLKLDDLLYNPGQYVFSTQSFIDQETGGWGSEVSEALFENRANKYLSDKINARELVEDLTPCWNCLMEEVIDHSKLGMCDTCYAYDPDNAPSPQPYGQRMHCNPPIEVDGIIYFQEQYKLSMMSFK